MSKRKRQSRLPRTPVELIGHAMELARTDWGSALRVTVVLSVLVGGVLGGMWIWFRGEPDPILTVAALTCSTVVYVAGNALPVSGRTNKGSRKGKRKGKP